MIDLALKLAPELLLMAVAGALFLLGTARGILPRRLAPIIALVCLLAVLEYQVPHLYSVLDFQDPHDAVHLTVFSQYIKLITAAIGILLVLLAWPANRDATGNSALNFGQESGEFFGLMLLSICGVFLIASANDIILLFLGLELASIPTYIMVAISRPLPAAQEAGVKYFFLGALSAALMLFGFSYLYGTTGSTSLQAISSLLHPRGMGADVVVSLSFWQMLGVILILTGLTFKIAAVPMHVYAGDVYQGAATPVTAFLSFVPKASGFVAIIKLLGAIGGEHWALPPQISRLLWILAVLTMTVGNILGLLQYNIKRLLAYSSIAHSGYMLAGLAALTAQRPASIGLSAVALLRVQALSGVLFYLAAYGLANITAFGVLILLPPRGPRRWHLPGEQPSLGVDPDSSAETFEDLAGQGRRYKALGLAMAVACFSLIGIPLTAGFFAKFMLIRPAFSWHLYGLAIITVINAAISAGYYLKIVGSLFLRTEDSAVAPAAEPPARHAPAAIATAVILSAFGTIVLGTLLPAAGMLHNVADSAAQNIVSVQSPGP